MTHNTKAVAVMQLVAAGDIDFSKTNELFRDPSEFTPDSLRELAASIEEHGLVQPIALRPGKHGKYLLIAGERRVKACKLLDPNYMVPAVIRDVTEDQALKMQIIENLQRENLNPIREARGFDILVNQKKYVTSQIAAEIGKSIDYVQERLRLATLIPTAQQMIIEGYLPLKAGLKLARIPDKKKQQECLEACTDELDLNGSQVASNDLSYKKTQKIVFKGLDRMQEWMDSNLFTDLTLADFDKEDPKLNPPMGACGGCRNRTKNTQGLFDDIIVDDKCLLPACYRIKQINTYKALRDELKKKYPKAKVIFKRRDNSVDGRSYFDKALAGLGEVIGAGSGEIIPATKGEKMKRPTLAILIGIAHNEHGEHGNDKKGWVYWQPTARKPMRGSSSKPELTEAAKKQLSPEDQAKQERKLQDSVRQTETLNEVMVDLAFDQVQKAMSDDKLLDIELQIMVDDIDNDFAQAMPRIFQRLGLNWWNGKKEISHKGFDSIGYRVGNEDGLDNDDIEKTLQRATTGQKKIILAMGRLFGYYYSAGVARKLFGVPSESALKQKASGKAGELFKKYVADRAVQEAKDKKPEVPGNPRDWRKAPKNYGEVLKTKAAAQAKRVVGLQLGHFLATGKPLAP